jgi:hypothetical protein
VSSRRLVLTGAGLLAVAGLAVSAATAASRAPTAKKRAAAHHVLIGIQDDANTLYGVPEQTFPYLEQLRAQVLRVNMIWGGAPHAVATSKPTQPANPADPAYDWTLYDRVDRYASQYGIRLVFSILFTPRWANGGRARNVAPTTKAGWNQLRLFANAAAKRYSGAYVPPLDQQDPSNSTSSTPLPAVRFWTAWNEPNNPIWLKPQWRGKTIVSARNYVKICNAVYSGVHASRLAGEKVACGVTGPRGNDNPRSSRPSVDPLSFMAALKRYGLKRFDVYAHNPYYGSPRETPRYKPRGRAIQLGNINVLLAQLKKLWGPKHLWITEYGYQTRPQDKLFGVSWAKQALYLRQAYAIARANPRIDMMVWFMLKDDTNVRLGWQSGLMTATWQKKPSFVAFQRLPR